jgi:hypothetical protein
MLVVNAIAPPPVLGLDDESLKDSPTYSVLKTSLASAGHLFFRLPDSLHSVKGFVISLPFHVEHKPLSGHKENRRHGWVCRLMKKGEAAFRDDMLEKRGLPQVRAHVVS